MSISKVFRGSIAVMVPVLTVVTSLTVKTELIVVKIKTVVLEVTLVKVVITVLTLVMGRYSGHSSSSGGSRDV